MKKKKGGGGGANWMDTYGDMVTLLLCFFVLLYSMSSISEEAWKNLVMSFNPYAVMSGESQGGGGPSDDGDQAGVMPAPEVTDQDEIDEQMEILIQAFQSLAGSNDSVDASNDGGRIYLSFDGTTFFKGNSDALTAEALPVLDVVGEELSKAGWAIDEVRIGGHTAQYSPDEPNNVMTDRMLSATRAARVCAYIQSITNADVLDPAKLVSEGWGQWHPRSANDSEEGRARNRRVEMIISGRELETELDSAIPSYTTDSAQVTDSADTLETSETSETPETPDASDSPGATA